MLDKNNRARCDECGRYVSWRDIESGKAHYSTGITGDYLCNVWEYYDCLCPTHNNKDTATTDENATSGGRG